ncbi:MAG TPA: uroporphyrinogen decarboxylase family protein [Bacteroidota bacterium]|nr:uroporphyrinogen decarboxylase family protein [Bacteroidota bacterium]
MSRRDDFSRTLRHETPEHLLLDLGGCPLSGMEGRSMHTLLDYLGFTPESPYDVLPFGITRRIDERILNCLDIDTRSVGSILIPNQSQKKIISDREYIDEWGIRRIHTGMYWEQVSYPLRDATVDDLDSYAWPDPGSIDADEIRRHASEAKRLFEETDYVICAEHPVYGIFELGCWMCGFDDFLIRTAIDHEFVHRFFARILEYQKAVIEQYYGALGSYVHYTSSGDDFATQSGLFLSPDMFTSLIKPYFAERIRFTKQFTRAAFLHHSCGSVFPIIGELIDAGVEILNPIQPKASMMDPRSLKETYGNSIVFHGGIDTQELLPFGTGEQIEESVRATINVMNDRGG